MLIIINPFRGWGERNLERERKEREGKKESITNL